MLLEWLLLDEIGILGDRLDVGLDIFDNVEEGEFTDKDGLLTFGAGDDGLFGLLLVTDDIFACVF